MVCDLRNEFIRGTMSSFLLTLTLENDSCHVLSNYLWRGPCGKELRPPTKSHVSVPSWKPNLQLQSSLQMTAAPANILTATTLETLSQNLPDKLLLNF